MAQSFRTVFSLPNMNVMRWFPGHMHTSMFKMQARLKDIDCIIEVHDARIPFSGRDSQLKNISELKPHILLLNKADLVDKDLSKQLKVIEKLQSQGIDAVFYTEIKNFERNAFLKKTLIPEMHKLVDSKPRFNREGLEEYNAMVIGIPNVGKSTLINTLRWANIGRRGKAVRVGNTAGVTRKVSGKVKVSNIQQTFIIDTPGILAPRIPDLENGMRLALCACVPDHFVGVQNISDYLLYWLNKRQHFSYVDYFQLDQPEDSVMIFLSKIALKNNFILNVKDIKTNEIVKRPDYIKSSNLFLEAFRKGELGMFLLDDDM